jgi:5-methylcytosine-specific restriction endonuclease McrA
VGTFVPKAIPARIRQSVTERDGGRCRWCGTPTSECHHIVYRSQGGQDEVDNLILLCTRDHALVHSNKRRFMPLLLATLEYQRRGVSASVPQVERWLT